MDKLSPELETPGLPTWKGSGVPKGDTVLVVPEATMPVDSL